MIAYSAQGVVFDVQVDWTQAEGADMFYTADNDQVYGLNGASSLGSYTPQDFLEQLKDFYQSENEFDSLEVLSDLHGSLRMVCPVRRLISRAIGIPFSIVQR